MGTRVTKLVGPRRKDSGTRVVIVGPPAEYAAIWPCSYTVTPKNVGPGIHPGSIYETMPVGMGLHQVDAVKSAVDVAKGALVGASVGGPIGALTGAGLALLFEVGLPYLKYAGKAMSNIEYRDRTRSTTKISREQWALKLQFELRIELERLGMRCDPRAYDFGSIRRTQRLLERMSEYRDWQKHTQGRGPTMTA